MVFMFVSKFLVITLLVFMFLSAACTQGPENACLDKVIISYAAGIDGGNVWPKRGLQNEFVTYWCKRFSGESEFTWQMEAPHFQYMIPWERYDTFITMGIARLPVHAEIFDISAVSDNLYAVNVQLTFTRAGKEHSVNIMDSWLFLDGRWHHVVRDSFFFKL